MSNWICNCKALQISTTVLLSLFLPLSFLLFSRISAALRSDDFSFPLLCNGVVLYSLLSFLAVAAFLRRITAGRVDPVRLLLHRSPEIGDCDRDRNRRSLSTVWLIICVLVLVVELGVEIQLPAPEIRRNSSRACSVSRGLFFAIGLYEMTVYWSESVVEPVLDRRGVGGTAAERIGLGMSFGVLWWWRLRGHVDSLAAVPATVNTSDVIIPAAEYFRLGLFYLILITGIVRVFAGAAVTIRLSTVRKSSELDHLSDSTQNV